MRSGKKKKNLSAFSTCQDTKIHHLFLFPRLSYPAFARETQYDFERCGLGFFSLVLLVVFLLLKLFFSRLNRTCFPIFSFLFVYSFIPSLIARSVGAFPYPSFFFRFCFSLHFKPTDWTLLLLKSRLNGLAFNRRHSLFFVVLRHFFFSQHSKLLRNEKTLKENISSQATHTHTKNRRNVCSNFKRERQRETQRMPADI